MRKTWLITGCTSGLGRSLAETVLSRGDCLLATSRDISGISALKEQFGPRVELFQLEVTSRDSCREAVQRAVQAFGQLDVLVNNAGYARVGPFELRSLEDIQKEIDTNLLSVIHTAHAVLPIFRAQRTGSIINISSSAGRVGAAGTVAYCAAKFGVAGFSEALAKEVASLGVEVISVEPGSLRTNWTSAALASIPKLDPEYEAILGPNLKFGRTIVGNEPGDPARCAAIIFDLSRRKGLPSHLVLGSDAIDRIAASERERAAAAEKWQAVSRSSDFGE